jgi:hypothetical protein
MVDAGGGVSCVTPPFPAEQPTANETTAVKHPASQGLQRRRLTLGALIQAPEGLEAIATLRDPVHEQPRTDSGRHWPHRARAC